MHVLVSQLKELFGLKNTIRYNGAFKIPRTLYDIASKLDSTNLPTLLTSTCCILYLLLFKEFLNPKIKRRIKFDFPAELLLVSSMILIIVKYKSC